MPEVKAIALPAYLWRTGDVFPYSVRIQLQTPGYTEKMAGTLIYAVRSVDAGRATIAARGVLFPERHDGSGAQLLRAGPIRMLSLRLQMPSSRFEQTLDAVGRPTSRETGPPAMCLLADLTRLVFPPLPRKPAGLSVIQHACVLLIGARDEQIQDSGEDEGSLGARNRPVRVPAHEQIQSQVTQENDNFLQFHVLWQLDASSQETETAHAEGDATFDRHAGVCRSYALSGKMNGFPGPTAAASFTVEARLLEGSERTAALTPAGLSAPFTRPMDAADIEKAVSQLGSGDRWQQIAAADALSEARPDHQRKDVAESLVAALKSADPFVRRACLRALGAWGGPQDVAVLAGFLSNSDMATRWSAIQALGATGTPGAAQVLVGQLSKTEDRARVVTALQQIGEAGTSAVIPMIHSQDAQIRLAVCQVLNGRTSSEVLAALRTAIHDPVALVSLAANNALDRAKDTQSEFRGPGRDKG